MSDYVSNKDLYEAITKSTTEIRTEFTRAIQRLEDGVLANQTVRLDSLSARVSKLETRTTADRVRLGAIMTGIMILINAGVVLALRVLWPPGN